MTEQNEQRDIVDRLKDTLVDHVAETHHNGYSFINNGGLFARIACTQELLMREAAEKIESLREQWALWTFSTKRNPVTDQPDILEQLNDACDSITKLLNEAYNEIQHHRAEAQMWKDEFTEWMMKHERQETQQ